ncbi:MAG: TonB family protein [Myxococcota bacterium]
MARSRAERIRASDRLKWSILASGWVHVGAALALLIHRIAVPPGAEPTRGPLVLVRMAPAPVSEALDEETLISSIDREAVQAEPATESPADRRTRVEPPEPEPVDAMPHEAVEYVRIDAPGEAPEHADRISSEDHRAREEVRARVTTDTPGPLTPRQAGAAGSSQGGAASALRSGMRVSRVDGGGGSRAQGSHRATTGQSGNTSEGGSPTRAAAGSAVPSGHQVAGGSGSTQVPEHPDATRRATEAGPTLAPADASGRETPSASASFGAATPPTSRHDAADSASPTNGDGLATLDSPGSDAATGGEPDHDLDAPASPGHRDATDAGVRSTATLAPFDPVEDLRAFMGWQRPEFADGGGASGTGDADGAPDTSPTAANARVVRDYVDVSARQDPLGVYMRKVEAVLTDRWMDNDLSVRDRARGIQGDVVVRYTIHANGRIDGVELVRQSGHSELDLLALAAVPDRVPRIPRELNREALHHQVTLRYRNPFIVTVDR